MRPKETLDLRADLASKLSSPAYRQGMAAITQSSRMMKDFQEALRLSDWTLRTISSAENFFVIPEMSDLVEYSGSVLDSSDIMDTTLPPSRSGFAYFQKGLRLIDVQQKGVIVHAILWDTAIDGSLVVHMWNDEYREPDDAAVSRKKEDLDIPPGLSLSDKKWEEWLRVQGRWGYAGLVVYEHGKSLGEMKLEVSEEIARQYEDVAGVRTEPFTNPHRLIHAFWLLLSQTLVAREIERGDRKMARRMKKMGVPNEVTIITFRRTDYDPKMEGIAKVEWSHRWLVRGFWRWQPYKNEEGKWDRKRIWINPYVKGPADKPLVITQKINAFVR